MSKLSRRTVLMCGLLGTQALLAACGGGGGGVAEASTGKAQADAAPAPAAPTTPMAPSAPAPAPAPAPEWNIKQNLSFVAGALASFDLNDTLPTGIARGGVFSVDSSGERLPTGATLTANGLLTVTASAVVGVTSGVVFAYAAP